MLKYIIPPKFYVKDIIIVRYSLIKHKNRNAILKNYHTFDNIKCSHLPIENYLIFQSINSF